jgi:hypothetical protein
MRVLFLYYHYPSAEPLLSAREDLAKHDVLLEAYQVASPEGPSTSSRHVLPKLGDFLVKPFDLLLIQHQIMQEEALFCKRPVAILERCDGSQLESRHWLPNVAAVIKSCAMRPRKLHNECYGRLSCAKLAEAGIKATHSMTIAKKPPQLTDEELAKIHVGYGFASYQRMGLARQQCVDLSAPRKFECQFRGHTYYNGSEIERHRQIAAMTAADLSLKRPGTVLWGPPIEYGPYLAEMLRSEVVVSPWGWGEACYRDYEAWLLGAVVVKPNTDYVEAWPDVYVAGETYVSCAPDFSDLGEVIAEIHENWDRYHAMRVRAREAVFGAGDPGAVASHMAVIFRQLVEEKK